jgi:hypothetical protein
MRCVYGWVVKGWTCVKSFPMSVFEHPEPELMRAIDCVKRSYLLIVVYTLHALDNSRHTTLHCA